MRLASKGFILKVHQVQAEIVEEWIMKGKLMQKNQSSTCLTVLFFFRKLWKSPGIVNSFQNISPEFVFPEFVFVFVFQNLYFLLWLVGSKHLIQICIFQNFQSSKGSPTGKLCLINGVRFITCWCLLKSLKISKKNCKC